MTIVHKLALGLGVIALLSFTPTASADNICKEVLSGFSKKEKACTCYYEFGSHGIGGTRWTDPKHGTKYILPTGCEEYCEASILCGDGRRVKTTLKDRFGGLFGDDSDDELPPDDIPDDFPPADIPDDLPPDDPANQFCQPPDGDTVGQAPNEEQNGIIPVANAQIYSNYSVVTHIEGEVLIKTKNAPRWAPAFKGQRMTIGDKIKTGRNGKAEVKFANSSVFTMRPTSQLEVRDHPNPSYCHLNFTGKVMWKLGGKYKDYATRSWQLKQEYMYMLRTVTAIAGGGRPNPLKGEVESDTKVAANIFNVSSARAFGDDIVIYGEHDETTGTTSFYVEEGEVDVLDANETESVPLVAGEYLAVESGILPQVDNILPGLAMEDQWWEEDKGVTDYLQGVLGLAIGGGFVYFVIKKNRKKKKKVK